MLQFAVKIDRAKKIVLFLPSEVPPADRSHWIAAFKDKDTDRVITGRRRRYAKEM